MNITPAFAPLHHHSQQNGVVDDSPPDELGATSQTLTVDVMSNRLNI